ncbi:MAG: hypothetical protein C5B56_13365 [Proteobacteria bacterium]|nr:MAG: hypothetical protein C5B56_13365 [Pseudomonadota bacterium]
MSSATANVVSPSYGESAFPVRADIAAAHAHAWSRLAGPGAWLDGRTRVAIAAETRAASECALCRRRKEALSPAAIDGRHDGRGELPERMVEQIHRTATDPARLTRRWFDQVIAAGTSDVEYVEIVGVVVTTITIDTFCRAIGVSLHPLPQPLPGEPHRRRPRTARQRGESWVPMIHPDDLTGDPATEEERALARQWGGTLANIRRALSLVPEEAYEWFVLTDVQYLPGEWMRDFAHEYRAITHAQIELIAGRVSVRNQCFY